MKYLLILLILFSNTNCAWSEISDFQRAKQKYEEKKLEALKLKKQLEGVDSNKVREVLGKPVEIKKKPYPYLADPNCTGPNCEKKWADEIWFYEFTYKDESGKHVYSINVYFEKGKVVEVY